MLLCCSPPLTTLSIAGSNNQRLRRRYLARLSFPRYTSSTRRISHSRLKWPLPLRMCLQWDKLLGLYTTCIRISIQPVNMRNSEHSPVATSIVHTSCHTKLIFPLESNVIGNHMYRLSLSSSRSHLSPKNRYELPTCMVYELCEFHVCVPLGAIVLGPDHGPAIFVEVYN